MRKWEKDYEYYKSSEAQSKYKELKEKIDSKKAKQEELNEYNKMTKIFENLPKVENIKDYMEKLDKNLEILKKEFYLREDEEKENRQIRSLENASAKLDMQIQQQQAECEKIRADQKEIQNNINALVQSNEDGKNDDQINSLRNQKNKLEEKYEKTLLSIQDKEDKIRDNKAKKEEFREDWKTKIGRPELAKFTKKELRKECFETAGMISKCNVVAGHLMNGYSRESIELKLADWKDRKFTAKDPLPLTRKEREERNGEKPETKKESGKGEDKKIITDNNTLADELKRLNPDIKMSFDSKGNQIIVDGDISKLNLPEGFYYNEKNGITNKHDSRTGGLYTSLHAEEGHVEEEKAMTEPDKFAKAYPRLSRILPNFIKNSKFAQRRAENKLEKMGYFDKPEPEDEKPEPVKSDDPDLEKIKKGLEAEADKFTDRDKFVKSLRTANVLDVADKGIDTMETDRKAEKLEKAKQDAIARQNAKLGEDYSKKSGDER